MRHASTKLLRVLAGAGLSVALLAGCGNSVPPNGVAKVGDTVIKKTEFDKWLKITAQGSAPGGQAAVPDPPEFKKCVAAQEKQPAPQGGKKPSAAELKKQCRAQYDELKNNVMQRLIQSEWLEQEAADRGVKVSNAEVQKNFEDRKKKEFPKEADYQRFLKQSGLSEREVISQLRLEVVQQKLIQKVTQEGVKVTEKDISDYYAKNKKRFAQPERRDLNVVLTKSEAKAEQAKRALDRGGSFKSVSKRFSIDEASKGQGGSLPDVTPGQQEKAFDKAIFAAPTGKVEGPVKTQFGFYVFEVKKVKKATQQSLAQSKDAIRSVLRSQREQKVLNAFVKEFREKHKKETTCADDFRVAECDNAPKPKTDTGPVSGGAPGGQQAPQGGGQVPPGAGGQVPPGAGGAPPQGAPPQGAPPQGAPPQGAPPQGAPPQGAPPQGAPQQVPPQGGAPPQGP